MATEVKENPKFEKVAGELEAWSILEIAQFGKFLQERWGVSAAPVAVAAAGGGAGAGGGGAPGGGGGKTGGRGLLKEGGAAKNNAIKTAPERPRVGPKEGEGLVGGAAQAAKRD